MCQTTSPGLVGASHWVYVAAAMATALEGRAADADNKFSVPQAVYGAAKYFFRLVVEAISPGVPSNPVASAASYCIAVHALQMTPGGAIDTDEEFNNRLRQYATVVDALDPEKPRPDVAPGLLLEIAQFFWQIVQYGETETYERYTSSPDTTVAC